MSWWQVILFPVSWLYNLGTSLRNHLYNIGYSKTFDFDVNVISVGNLTVGGTGKSPMVMYLAKLLRNANREVAVLSRGYKRKSAGQVFADQESTALDIGDEPLMIYKRFQGEVPVAVSEDRVLGVPSILLDHPDTEVILLDDAYQHRRIGRNLNILLTTYSRPFYRDHVLPTGLLRENRNGADRADILIITKCPDSLTHDEMEAIKKECRVYASDTEIFFTATQYGPPVGPEDLPKSWIAVSGIAGNDSFLDWCEGQYPIKSKYAFPDHHRYSKKDILKITRELEGDVGLITTEKDFVKLVEFSELDTSKCYYLPIEIKLLEDTSFFQDLIFQSLRQYKDSPVR